MLAFKAVKLNQKHTKVYIAKMFMNFIVAKAFAPKLFFCCLPTDRTLRWQFCHHTPKKQYVKKQRQQKSHFNAAIIQPTVEPLFALA